MPLLPAGSVLTIQASSLGYNTTNLIIEDVNYTYTSQDFDRLEWSNVYLRDKLNPSGSTPLYLTGFGNNLIQVTTTCDSILARTLTADDANIDLIYRKFKTKRWTFKGGPTLNSQLLQLYAIAEAHKLQLDQFNLYLKKLQASISYNTLLTLRTETFSYLTNTGISMIGNIFSNETVWDILLTDFSIDLQYEIPATDDSNDMLIGGWTLIIETRENVPASQTS